MKALFCLKGGNHELWKGCATLVDRHPLAYHPASGVVLALTHIVVEEEGPAQRGALFFKYWARAAPGNGRWRGFRGRGSRVAWKEHDGHGQHK